MCDIFREPAVCSLLQPHHAEMPMVAAAWTLGFINLQLIIYIMSGCFTKLQIN